MVIATTFILCIHCYFQPYQETRANFSEMIFLFVLSGLGVFQMSNANHKKRDKLNLAVFLIMSFYTFILVAIKLVVLVKNRTKSVKSEEYNRLDNEIPSNESAPSRVLTDKSLEERREKLAFLFARSETPSPKA